MIRWIYILFLSTALFLGLGVVLQKSYFFWQTPYHHNPHPHDNYDPVLIRLNSMDILESFIDSLAATQNITPDSIPDYINLADSVVRMRFYHGLQNYPYKDNWIANVLGKYVWSHLGAKVIPDDILKGQKAFCSQSSIVFQEFLKRKGFFVRSVLLPGHFCTEVSVHGNWQFHDVSYKPSFIGLPSLSAQDLIESPDYIEQAYLYSFADNFRENYKLYFDADRIAYGKVNAFAAPTMALFHQTTEFLGSWGWLLFLAAALATRLLQQRKSGKGNTAISNQ